MPFDSTGSFLLHRNHQTPVTRRAWQRQRQVFLIGKM
jgi:hypothetical protein